MIERDKFLQLGIMLVKYFPHGLLSYSDRKVDIDRVDKIAIYFDRKHNYR